jgi:predicted metal-binding membrane protein
MTDITSSPCDGAHPRCRGGVTLDASERAARAAFFGVAALLLTASAIAAIAWSRSMTAMGGLPMSGGWMLPFMWTRMCGESWLGTAAAFLAMWTVMMPAMMLPALTPTLWRYRRAFGRMAAHAAG